MRSNTDRSHHCMDVIFTQRQSQLFHCTPDKHAAAETLLNRSESIVQLTFTDHSSCTNDTSVLTYSAWLTYYTHSMVITKCNEVENAFPIFKVSRLVRVHTDSHHNGHNKMIFAVSYM